MARHYLLVDINGGVNTLDLLVELAAATAWPGSALSYGTVALA